MSNPNLKIQTILGLDPGRDKCGVAVMNSKPEILDHQVVDSDKAIATISELYRQYNLNLIVIGDGTTSKAWREQINSSEVTVPVVTINETNSTLEARDRYWEMYPPQGLQRIVPQSLRIPPRPIDDIVAILLIERYLGKSR